MIKNIIFDFGGVIADLDREEAVERFAALGVKDAEAVFDVYRQRGIFLEIEEGLIDTDTFCQKLSEYCGRAISFEEAKHAWLGFIPRVLPYKLDYLDELRKKYNVYVLSNTNQFFMSWACSSDFTSAGRPLDDYVDKIYASYQLHVTKPNPKIFEMMLQDSGMNPAESIFVDDGQANVDAGRNAGFHVLKAVNGEDYRDELNRMLAELQE